MADINQPCGKVVKQTLDHVSTHDGVLIIPHKTIVGTPVTGHNVAGLGE